jgi:formylglycine-generating enzyme required for sulfatase activity
LSSWVTTNLNSLVCRGAVSLWLSVVVGVAGDTRLYVVSKIQNYQQTGPAVLSRWTDDQFVFYSTVYPFPTTSIGSASIATPNAAEYELYYERIDSTVIPAPNGEGLYYGTKENPTTGLAFQSVADMNAAFPNGTYTVRISTVNDGTRQVPLSLSGDAYPPIPQLANYAAAQAINSTASFTLSWFRFTGGTTDDFVWVRVRTVETDQAVFESPLPGSPGVLNGLATSVVIPANTLMPGAQYRGIVSFSKVTQRNTASYPGALGLAGYMISTHFPMATTGVGSPPSIATHPSPQTATIGGTATFTVAATGPGKVVYRWGTTAENSIPEAELLPFLDWKSDPTLVLTDVQTNYAGDYWVEVANDVGSMISQSARLTVLPQSGVAPTILSNPQSQTLPVGSTISLSVSASGTVPLAYQWRKSGINIPGASASSYTKPNAQTEDSGPYVVVVTNAYGSAPSQAAMVTVNPPSSPPVITIQPQSQSVATGVTVSFSVTATGTAPLTYDWWKDAVTRVGQTQSTVPTLVLSNVTLADAGAYAVVVSNVSGWATSQVASLSVTGMPPFIVTQPQDQQAYEGETVTFSVAANGTSPLSFQWLHGSLAVAGASAAALTVPHVQVSDQGNYAVVVTNVFGTATSAPVSLLVLANIPPRFTAIERASDGRLLVSLTANPGRDLTILTSTNLTSWSPLVVLPNPTGAIIQSNIGTVSSEFRFYRASTGGDLAWADPNRFAWITSGTFVMGTPTNEVDRSSNEGPLTMVTISRGYWIARHETTEAEWQSVTGQGSSSAAPVVNVTWDAATNYCALLTEKERQAGHIDANWVCRLPTEAEWEYAARAGTQTRFSFGDDPLYAELPQYAWFFDNNGGVEGAVHPVETKSPNPWGIYDMYGNAWEWCSDLYGPYPGGSVTNPQGAATGTDHVFRGGGPNQPGSRCRSAFRNNRWPTYTDRGMGVRVVLAPVN